MPSTTLTIHYSSPAALLLEHKADMTDIRPGLAIAATRMCRVQWSWRIHHHATTIWWLGPTRMWTRAKAYRRVSDEVLAALEAERRRYRFRSRGI